jgi:cytochrome P450
MAATAARGTLDNTWRPVPDHVPEELVIKFDQVRDPAIHARPWESIERLRERPLWWSPAQPINYDGPGYWIPTRAEDLRYVFQHPDLFSSENPRMMPGNARLIPLDMDPPDHTKYRHLIAAAFSPGAVEALAADADEWSVKLIEKFLASGECEFLTQFAQPFPTAIFCRIMGIPFERIDEFLNWNRILIHSSDVPEREKAVEEVGAYFYGLIEERRAAPKADLISSLIQGKVDGEPLDAPMLINMSILLFMAGLDTVTASLGWTIQYLATHQEDRDRLAADPSLIPNAIEEMLRYFAIVSPQRYVTRDCELAGVKIKAGDLVSILTVLGSRDPAEFKDASEVQFDREKNRHMSFALGPHRCVGSHLARAEMVTAVTEMLRLMPDFHIPADAVIKSHAGAVIGLDRLPLVWTVPSD